MRLAATAMLRIKIQKNIIPAVIQHPLLECNGFKFIQTGMAKEDEGHGSLQIAST